MKRIWITGGGSGIGAEMAKIYAEEGHNVFISGRNKNKLEKVSPDVTIIPCDITNIKQVKKSIKKMQSLDLVILNAGVYFPGKSIETNILEYKKTMEVNYFGTLNCLLEIIPIMKSKGGHIAVVSSLAGYRGLPNSSAYGSSKAALIHLCESMKAELEDYPIKLQVINPGFVKTPMTKKNNFDMPYLIEPKLAAAKIIEGLKKDKFEIAFPKPLARRIKILRLLPYNLYFYLIKRMIQK